jgi:hypothetical protein
MAAAGAAVSSTLNFKMSEAIQTAGAVVSSILNFKMSEMIQNTREDECIDIPFAMHFCIMKVIFELNLNFESVRLFCATRYNRVYYHHASPKDLAAGAFMWDRPPQVPHHLREGRGARYHGQRGDLVCRFDVQ